MSEQGPRRVLIVDDATLLRHLIAEGLRRRFPDIEFIEAEGVAEGYHRARQYQPRLAILDVSMPDGNGLDLARRFRDELPGTLVCICTLHDEPEFRQAAAESGAVSFIAKQGDFWNDTECVVRSAFGGLGGGTQGCEGVSL
jgi:DNA-binding NarL/FixJ family response regulator